MDEQGRTARPAGRSVSATPVILLHGIWMPGAAMRFLKRWLESDGQFQCHIHSYPSVRATLQQNADLLFDFVNGLQVAECHLVGHSLGGVVALRMLATHDDAPSGRVVCLGSPLCGSSAANVLVKTRWGKAITGGTLASGVVHEPASEWTGSITASRDVGVIAGTVPFGLGRMVTKFAGDNDGTVSVEETRLAGARDHLCIHLNHTALLSSQQVADQVSAFLRSGRFDR
ncbi:MAG: alpha/beta fold hydrolase [Woeseia sp.]|nr:alpha/beta fold hydrolase [Woeseia sp.]NNL54459.1 alpha/beta fold hydrolase [Woeseia sp.]